MGLGRLVGRWIGTDLSEAAGIVAFILILILFQLCFGPNFCHFIQAQTNIKLFFLF